MTEGEVARTAEFEAGVLDARKRLYGFALSLCYNHHKAEDLVQDTIAKALLKHEQYQHGTNLVGWLFMILRNDWYSQGRKKGREVADIDGIYASQVAVGEGQSHAYDLKVIRKRMRELNTLQRRCIELVAMNGYEYSEVAEMLGVPTGTVKSSVSRARTFLETGDMAALVEDGIAEAIDVPQGHAADKAESMYRAGAAASEIAAATGLSRADVMQVIADRKLRRA